MERLPALQMEKGKLFSKMMASTANISDACWVDDRGLLHFVGQHSNSSAFHQPFRKFYQDENIAFRHLGLILIEFKASSTVVRWDVKSVNTQSIDAALNYLDGLKPDQSVTLKFYFDGWNTENFLETRSAIRRIKTVSGYRNVELSWDVLIRQIPLENISQSRPLLKRTLSSWMKSKGTLPSVEDHEHRELFEHMLIMMLNDTQDGVIRGHVGRKSAAKKVFGANWSRNALLKSITSNGPEGQYMKQINPSYMEVLTSGEPRLEHIRAKITREGHEPVWVPYQRLLTPTTLIDGTPAVISMTDVTQELAIPFMDAEASR